MQDIYLILSRTLLYLLKLTPPLWWHVMVDRDTLNKIELTLHTLQFDILHTLFCLKRISINIILISWMNFLNLVPSSFVFISNFTHIIKSNYITWKVAWLIVWLLYYYIFFILLSSDLYQLLVKYVRYSMF